MAQTVQQTIEIPLLPFRRLGCAGSARRGEDSRVPQLQLVDAGGRCPGCGSHACRCSTTGAVMDVASF